MTDNRQQQIRQERREALEIQKARQEGKNHSYIDEDGCEVTVTPAGHVFYNAADWW